MNPPDAQGLRMVANQVVEAGRLLFEAPLERRAGWLAGAFALLRDQQSPVGRAARAQLPTSTGLSEPMVAWALDSALTPLTAQALAALYRAALPPHARALHARAGQLCVVVLAGNVFTAALRGLGFPLLFGWPVLAKASSHDDAFAHLVRAALYESDPELGDALRVVTFAADDDARTQALLEQADAVSVFGSDATLAAFRARLSSTVSFIGHGHGLGAAFIAAAALSDETRATQAARGLALDVAAYDQRGCLSPHVAFVEHGAPVAPAAFAKLVAEQLELFRVGLPRGPLPFAEASAQLTWRGIGAMRGVLFEGDGYAVSYESDAPLRASPGYRNLQVLSTESAELMLTQLSPLGVHLKSLGLAGVARPELLARNLPPRLAPRLCTLGSMQAPPIEALHDGVAPWEGLLRWVETT